LILIDKNQNKFEMDSISTPSKTSSKQSGHQRIHPPKNNQKAQGQYLELLNEFIVVK
jgi:hypothetical protein